MVFITPCSVFTVGKLHLVVVAVQEGPNMNIFDTTVANLIKSKSSQDMLLM
jgi:hypothetical protein